MKKWKILQSDYVLKNKIMRIRRDTCKMSDGRIAKDYFVIEKCDYCMIAAFTADKKLIMVEQYRHPIAAIDLEFPAGFVRKNESPISAAKRELLEETGYRVKSLKKINEFYASPGILTNKAHIFIGRGAIKISKQKLDPHEQIKTRLFSSAEARKLAKKGKIRDMGSRLVLEMVSSQI